MLLTSFIHQKPYEHIEYEVRRHPITLLPVSFFFIILLAMPVGVYVLIGRWFPDLLASATIMPLLILLGITYLLSVGLFYYTYFVSFYLDLLVLTNDRLLHIEQAGLFSRTISEVDLYKIQDVTSEVKGIFPTAFGYGDLLVQTAGKLEEFKIHDIPHPEAFRQQILDLADGDRKFHPGGV